MPFLNEKSYNNELGGLYRSFKADLFPHVVFKIILSENEDIWVERWTKTFVLGCNEDDHYNDHHHLPPRNPLPKVRAI